MECTIKSKYVIARVRLINKGFTAFELLGALIFICFAILAVNKYKTGQSEAREVNQLADQSISFSQIAIRYIEDNYRSLVQQTMTESDVVIPYAVLSGYLPTGNGVISIRNQTPCLYVTGKLNNTIRAYIIWGNNAINSKPLDQVTIGKVAQAIGGNAGNLTLVDGQYILSGYTENELNLSTATVNNIIKECEFISPLPKNTLVIDLTKNHNLFASIQGDIDRQENAIQADPTLKKSGLTGVVNQLTTMQANVYLDNIVKESTLTSSFYCDATQLPAGDANNACISYADSQGINMYPGTASWINSVLDPVNNQCIATAQAHFFSITPTTNCNGVSFGDANSYCPQQKKPGSGYWSLQSWIPGDSQCFAIPYASYTCQTWQYSYNICHNQVYINCTNGTIYTINGSCPPAGTQMPCTGQVWWGNDPAPVCVAWKAPQPCGGQVSVKANQTDKTNDLGFKHC